MKVGLRQAMSSDAEIDYRLLRGNVLRAWRNGKVEASELCDAQRELRRNAKYCGRPIDAPCPICEKPCLVEVTYVFGPRLPAHGRCITTEKELHRINARKQTSKSYVVEVCHECGWNHLLSSHTLGGKDGASGEGGENGKGSESAEGGEGGESQEGGRLNSPLAAEVR